MKKDWIIEEARKADSNKNIAILENPEVRDYLDNLLLKKFWPIIFSCLEQSGYNYSSEPNIETELSYEFIRSLSFMLFDGERFERQRAIFRGTLKLSEKDWMLEREFFLPLPKHNNPQAVIEILGNSRLRGNPPSLMIDKEKENDFYQIDFHHGEGAGWGLHDEEYVEEKIKKIIDINIRMYECSKGGISPEQIGEFLSLAYEAYEGI